jgi:aspartate kinase
MIVMKFGGSSVANRAQIEKVLGIVRARLDRRPVVVSSAHKGMTDALIHAARSAAAGRLDPAVPIDKQRGVAESLGCAPELLAPFYREIEDLLRGISLVKELSPRSLDYIASFGERMAVRCIADFFERNGTPSRAYDVWDLGFITDASFGRARPLPGFEARVKAMFAERVPAGVVPIVTGFVGRNEAGEITTVGRNGSDLTATLLAAALETEEAQIWSDTDGVMTADPSVVKTAQNIPTMHFDEAAELAYFGSRVLHPSTLLPAMEKGIPVRVLNTNRPEHPGTVIDFDVHASAPPVTSIAYRERQIVLTLSSTRMFGQVGFLAEVFSVLGRHEVVIDVIATSEVSVSMTTDDLGKLERALPELQRFGRCEVLPDKTTLVVVGKGLTREKGAAARVLQAMAEANVNVAMLSYGMGSINLSMVIDDADIARAVAVLHRSLFETAR